MNKCVLGVGGEFHCDPEEYRSLRPPKAFLLKTIEEAFRLASSKSGVLLDIGCGNAGYTKELASRLGVFAIGMDVSMEMLEQSASCGPVALVNACANQCLPFADNVFGVVISVDSIHFVKDLGRLFGELNRILAPGGIFILCTHTASDLERQTLGVYFPETVALELRSARRLGAVHRHAHAAGLRYVFKRRDFLRFAPDRVHLRLFERKCASALHNVSAFGFSRGLRALKRDAATKRRIAAHSYTTFAFIKPPL